MSTPSELQQLVALFNPKKDNSDSEDDENLPSTSSATSKADKVSSLLQPSNKTNPYSKVNTANAEEEYQKLFDPDKDDANWKKTPKWSISYKQQVTSSDVFLQMGFKNPSTASCEDMKITIDLPGEKRQNVDLKIEPDKMILVSPNYYLNVPLPHPVDPKKGAAQFDVAAETLTVTLRMDRPMDYINF